MQRTTYPLAYGRAVSSEYLYRMLKFKADNDCQASIQGGFSRRVAGYGAAGRMKILATDMFAKLTEY